MKNTIQGITIVNTNNNNNTIIGTNNIIRVVMNIVSISN
jgi:hypothetical protein